MNCSSGKNSTYKEHIKQNSIVQSPHTLFEKTDTFFFTFIKNRFGGLNGQTQSDVPTAFLLILFLGFLKIKIDGEIDIRKPMRVRSV